MTPYDTSHDEENIQSSERTDAPRPTRAEAEAAVETLLRWAGDDPDREGL